MSIDSMPAPIEKEFEITKTDGAGGGGRPGEEGGGRGRPGGGGGGRPGDGGGDGGRPGDGGGDGGRPGDGGGDGGRPGKKAEPETEPQAEQSNNDDLAIRKKFCQSVSLNNPIIDNFLKFNSTIDIKLKELTKDQELNKKLIKNLKDSADPLYVELREYILNRPDSPLGSDSGSISDFKDLKEASAIGVLVTSQKTGEIKHSYEAREQAVNFLCYRGEDNKYEIKDEYKQDKDKDTALLQHGIECFKDDEDKLFTKSPSFKGFKDFENSIKPILSFFPPLQTALSALGPLLLGERELSGTIHGIRFRPSDYSTKTTVEKIEKSSQILLK